MSNTRTGNCTGCEAEGVELRYADTQSLCKRGDHFCPKCYSNYSFAQDCKSFIGVMSGILLLVFFSYGIGSGRQAEAIHFHEEDCLKSIRYRESHESCQEVINKYPK